MNDSPATPMPRWSRMRLMIVAISPIAAMTPTIPPITLIDALDVIGSRHVRQLVVTSTLLSERPVVAIPIRPRNTATQRALPDCDNAALICLARPLLTLDAPLTSCAVTH